MKLTFASVAFIERRTVTFVVTIVNSAVSTVKARAWVTHVVCEETKILGILITTHSSFDSDFFFFFFVFTCFVVAVVVRFHLIPKLIQVNQNSRSQKAGPAILIYLLYFYHVKNGQMEPKSMIDFSTE